jgi:ketosteroid isomerase-like protein
MKNVLFTMLLLGLVVLVRAQTFKNKDLQSLVDAEIGFAKLAKEKTNREAFLANVNQESLTLAEEIKPTKTHWEKEKIDSMWLNWHPSFADVAASGDLGYTYGPWTGHPNKKAPAEFGGHYITVWSKQSDGSWKIAIDAGIVHGEKTKVEGTTVKSSKIKSAPVVKNADAKKELLTRDQQLQASLKSDPSTAYQSVASSEIKFFRPDLAPFSNASDIPKLGIPANVKQLEGGISAAGDFGYTYGLIFSDAGPGAPATHRTFLRIWKKEDGSSWKLVLDAIL